MNCWHCKKKLIWGGDHSYEDCGTEGDGIVSNLSCPNEECGVEQVLVYFNTEEKLKRDCEQYKHKNDNSKNSVKAWKRKQIKLAGEWIRNLKKLCKEMNL